MVRSVRIGCFKALDGAKDMSFLHDPFWQFIINGCIAIAGIIIPLLVGVVQSKKGGNSSAAGGSVSNGDVGCWVVPTIVLSIMLIIVIVFSGIFFTFASQLIGNLSSWKGPGISFPSLSVASDPGQVLDSYCQDVSSGAYQQAYDEYSTSLKSKVSSSQFTQMWVDQHLDACTHDSVQVSGSSASTALSTHDFFTKNTVNYNVTLVKDGSNGWKIDSIQQQ
jgi:hypothetical protein